jgi:hypothetical protein
MTMRRFIALGFACALFAACRPDPGNVPMPKAALTAPYVPDPDLKSDLGKAASLRVYFGHQSVGGNVVEGLQELRALAGDTALRIVHDPSADALPPAFFAESKVGTNGDPLGKLAVFRRAVDTALAGRLDVALVKICYVDLNRGYAVDPDSLFAAYRKTVLDLEAAHPGLAVIPVTSPLTVSGYGARGRLDRLKGEIARWLGRPDDNARRAVFNARLREAFRDRPLFDLAAVESTRPDGSRVRYGRGGEIEALAPEYSADGGHLNALGRKVAARALLRVLAQAGRRAPGAPSAVGAPHPNT